MEGRACVCVCVCVYANVCLFLEFPFNKVAESAGCSHICEAVCVLAPENIIQLLPYCTCFDLFGIITDAFTERKLLLFIVVKNY